MDSKDEKSVETESGDAAKPAEGKTGGAEPVAEKPASQQEINRFMSGITAQGFEQFWKQAKKQLKDLSKRELAQESFAQGANFMLEVMRRVDSAQKEKTEEKRQ